MNLAEAAGCRLPGATFTPVAIVVFSYFLLQTDAILVTALLPFHAPSCSPAASEFQGSHKLCLDGTESKDAEKRLYLFPQRRQRDFKTEGITHVLEVLTGRLNPARFSASKRGRGAPLCLPVP